MDPVLLNHQLELMVKGVKGPSYDLVKYKQHEPLLGNFVYLSESIKLSLSFTT